MEESKHDKALNDWLKGEISEGELNNEISEKDIDLYSDILKEVDSWKVPSTAPEYSKLLAKRDLKKTKKISFPRVLRMAIAASFVLMLTLFYFKFTTRNIRQFETGLGETMSVALPDGSKVILNSLSTLSYDEVEYKKVRQIEISGQCYFDVEKGTSFSVDFGKGSLKVLGTTFEVKSRDLGFNVKCFSGKIKVSAPDNEACILTKGIQAVYVDGSLNSSKFLSTGPNWLNGYYQYQNEALDQILDDLKYEHGLTISGLNHKKKFTGKLPKNDLNLAIKTLLAPLSISYQLDGKNLILN